MKKLDADLRSIYDREVFDIDLFEAWLARNGLAWEKLDRGEYDGLNLDKAIKIHIAEDPVLWCKAFMNDPETGDPYTFWDYQEPAVRAWQQDGIYQCGAEVGKTREITAILLWGQCTGFGFTVKNPTVLVGAPQQVHLNEIVRDMEQHLGESDANTGRKPLVNRFHLRTIKVPHVEMRFKGPTCTREGMGIIFFRPAGHDGEAFRGVHVNAGGLMDEAAKIKNKVIWSEFWRALKPGCFRKAYSVPDGDNTTTYYQYTQQAVDDLPPGKPGWRRWYWPKTLMPKPFWSEERDKEFQRLYGGKDSPGYQRNVLGLHGQQENPVWPWHLLEWNLRSVPEYRVVKLHIDESKGDLDVKAFAVEIKVQEKRKHGEEHVITDRTEDLAPFKDSARRRQSIRELLREFIEPVGDAVLWAGADLGFSNDPTEIFLCQEIGTELRDLVRIQAKGVSYDLQCELIYCLDELTGFNASWGVDFGSAGTAVVQMLQNLAIYEDGHYDERLTGFNFATAVDAIDEDGNQLMQEDDRGNEKPIRLPAKELATNLITARFQRYGWALPYDTEVIGHFSNHTAREGQKHRIFDKKDDHTIDAKRVLILRKAFNDEIGVADVFSSGVHVRAA